MTSPEFSGDLPRLISRIERRDPSVFPRLADLQDHHDRAPVLGVTGPPGVGKSSLVNRMVRHLRDQGVRVAVVAVDPTSPFSGGALLGDRVRMGDHGEDPGVFIRSMSTRGHLGGLNSAVHDVVLALSAAGFDRILLETVGVGQGEVEVFRCSDYTLVVLVDAYGDSVQLLKAGLQEVADGFVLNKIDRFPADQLQADIEMLQTSGPSVSVFPVSAASGEGMPELLSHLDGELPGRAADPERRRRTRRYHLESLLREHIEHRVQRSLSELSAPTQNPYRSFEDLLEQGWDLGSRPDSESRGRGRGPSGD